MPVGSCQLFGYFLVILSTLFIIGVSVYPGWQVSDDANNSKDVDPKSYGLFWMCKDGAYSNKDFLCNKLNLKQHELPVPYQISRILMLCACATSLLSVAITPIGLQCTLLGGEAATKCVVARIGGALIALSGIFCFSTSLVYGNYVRSNSIDYKCQLYNSLTRNEIENVLSDESDQEPKYAKAQIRDIIFCDGKLNSVPRPENYTIGPAVYILYALTCICSRLGFAKKSS